MRCNTFAILATLTWALLCLLVAPIVAAESLPGWPHIRGVNHDGVSIEMGLVDSFPASGPPVLWVKELGQGYGSLVAQKNRVYTQYQTLAGQFVLCMNAETGETIWSYRYDWPFQAAGQYPGPFSTPTLADDHVYFTTPAGGVSCLTPNGKLVWSRDLKQEFGGMGTDFGYACSPSVVDGKVVLPVGGRGASVVALDSATGDLVWRSGDEAASYVGVLPIKLGSEIQVVAYLADGPDQKTVTRCACVSLAIQSHGRGAHATGFCRVLWFRSHGADVLLRIAAAVSECCRFFGKRTILHYSWTASPVLERLMSWAERSSCCNRNRYSNHRTFPQRA